MKIRSLSENEILSILKKAKEVSETERNPNNPANKRPMQKGKNCHGGAWARDLGATNKDQTMVRKMRYLVSLGLLREERASFPIFYLTEEGGRLLIS